mmetsp:Transcript_33602/g.50113  ORF Transcript_33602/g.50113 Transcript_33602/m.50113 type:complete len:123 (+) Transcript_33602:196-564(+)
MKLSTATLISSVLASTTSNCLAFVPSSTTSVTSSIQQPQRVSFVLNAEEGDEQQAVFVAPDEEKTLEAVESFGKGAAKVRFRKFDEWYYHSAWQILCITISQNLWKCCIASGEAWQEKRWTI